MAIPQKEVLEKMYKVCDIVANTGGAKEKLDFGDDIEFATILKIDLISFLAYLAASDGVISWKESRYIGELFDLHLTPKKLNDFIVEKDIYSTEFEQRPPIMMQIFVAFDNAIYNSPVARMFDEELGDGLLNLYVILARGLIESNDRTTDAMDENEEKDVQIYLGMLQNYIDENTEKHHTDIILEYSKSTKKCIDGSVRAPQKNQGNTGSVKAPRKKL